ncbi:ABC transporter [Penicillium alfredii]|uniref:ABC transporter n=1 Tax=Penicillium alfredii TaxID=1506179 RepID=A0A9W9FLG2_9EURO|nr:ABC transporter [Penicillium alfredii]KAJ5102401.1 ABC transporter [Penicillium alfredii]
MLPRTSLRPRALQLAFSRFIRPVSTAPLIHIQDGTFYKQYPTADDTSNLPLYPNFSFTLPSYSFSEPDKPSALDHWAIIGTSGRTDLLDILRGQHISIPPTARSYPYLLTDEIAAKDPRLRFVGNAVQYIGFSGEGSGNIGGTRGAYLSARYESHREETDWTVQQFLRGQTSLNPAEGEEKGTVHDEELFEQVISDLRLGQLLDMPVANLSNGQTRRARIAKALLKKPALLLLDEPFMGLDPATVRSISGLLHRLAEKCAPRLILALRPQDKVPDWITHLMILGNSHRVVLQGSKPEVEQNLQVWQHLVDQKPVDSLTPAEQSVFHQGQTHLETGILDQKLLLDITHMQTRKQVKEIDAYLGGEPVIEMDGVCVQYGDKAVLGDWKQKINGEEVDGLHWKVRRGQRWAILGANGSGKTTLLSLITSDHPQAYSQPIKLFGHSRLPEVGKPGISIFELQSRLGHSSPEIHAFFPRQLTVRQSLESAFAETFLSKPKLDYERDIYVSAILREFRAELDPNAPATPQEPQQVTVDPKLFPKVGTVSPIPSFVPTDYDVDYADHLRFGELSVAQQRIVLFLRALVHRPDIVILDEALSGLSASQRDKCLSFLELGEKLPRRKQLYPGLSKDQALIMISHVKEEIPDGVRFYMRLPSDPGDGSEPLDFRMGPLKNTSMLSHPATWESVWSPPSQFLRQNRRTFRRNPESITTDDMNVYEWYSV